MTVNFFHGCVIDSGHTINVPCFYLFGPLMIEAPSEWVYTFQLKTHSSPSLNITWTVHMKGRKDWLQLHKQISYAIWVFIQALRIDILIWWHISWFATMAHLYHHSCMQDCNALCILFILDYKYMLCSSKQIVVLPIAHIIIGRIPKSNIWGHFPAYTARGPFYNHDLT